MVSYPLGSLVALRPRVIKTVFEFLGERRTILFDHDYDPTAARVAPAMPLPPGAQAHARHNAKAKAAAAAAKAAGPAAVPKLLLKAE